VFQSKSDASARRANALQALFYWGKISGDGKIEGARKFGEIQR